MYYLLILAATVLFSIQFVFYKQYQREVGPGLFGTGCFLFVSSGLFALVLFFVNGAKLAFEPFSLLMAGINCLIGVACVYFGLIALSVSDLAKYSLYMMLGGMAIPFIYGFLFAGDAVTWQKLVCFFTIAAALLMSTKNASGSAKLSDWKARLCYLSIFLLNGLVGVVATVHQNPAPGVACTATNDFMLWCRIFDAAAGFLITLICAVRSGFRLPGWKSLTAASCYGLVNGAGNLMILISISHVEPSVQYPIITGGCVVLSVVFGLLFHEKPTRRSILCAGVTLLGTLILTIP